MWKKLVKFQKSWSNEGLSLPIGVLRNATDSQHALELMLTVLQERIALSDEEIETYLGRLAYSVQGWRASQSALNSKSLCRAQTIFRNWRAHKDLVVIRMAYDLMVLPKVSEFGLFQARLQRGKLKTSASYLWLLASEHAYRQKILSGLNRHPQTHLQYRPKIQAAFCIDVRSETIRRHFEKEVPNSQTFGFAGFFGLPIEFERLAAEQGGMPSAPSFFLLNTQ